MPAISARGAAAVKGAKRNIFLLMIAFMRCMCRRVYAACAARAQAQSAPAIECAEARKEVHDAPRYGGTSADNAAGLRDWWNVFRRHAQPQVRVTPPAQPAGAVCLHAEMLFSILMHEYVSMALLFQHLPILLDKEDMSLIRRQSAE